MRFVRRSTPQLSLPTLRTFDRRRRSTSLDAALAWTDHLYPEPMNRRIGRTKESTSLSMLVIAAVVFIAVGFTWRLFDLQVRAFDRYNELSEGNRIRESIVYAPRGTIYDRHGRVVAENTLSFQLSVTPYLVQRDEAKQAENYALIARILDRPVSVIQKAVESDGLDYPLPKIVASNITQKQAFSMWQYAGKLDGFSINEVPVRQYVSDSGLPHIVGYTGSVTQLDLDNDTSGALLPIDVIGKAGVELSYDAQLRGQNGLERTEVDTLGRPIRVLSQQRAQPGTDITLTIDLDVQRQLARDVQDQMKRAKVVKGSGVALDPNTGEVIAMVSFPSYDNNDFAKGISSKRYQQLINDTREPLINKVVSSGYTTGSTIKPVVAAAALQEGIVTPETIIVDRGAISVTSQYDPGAAFVFRGWRASGLGPMNVRSAIAWSSNIYFYTVGGGHGGIGGLGVERLTRYYRDFGMGTRTGIDLPGEIDGRVADPAWKKSLTGEDWFVGDTYNISIGQGDMLVSPMQLTLANMAIANGGFVLEPHVVRKVGETIVSERTVRKEVSVDKRNLQIVREGMRQVMTGGTTCDCVFAKVPVKVAGKSGTAQTTSDESRRPHAWFTAYAPHQDPTIMATVMLEEGSGGSQFAAPAIAGAMETYFKKPQ